MTKSIQMDKNKLHKFNFFKNRYLKDIPSSQSEMNNLYN